MRSNALADRIRELLELEREQAADLSHRLRTPLAALALEADALEDRGERQRMGAAVHDLTEAVNSVIVEVRQDRPQRVAEISDITETVRARLDFWSVLAEEQGRPWTSVLPESELIVAVPSADLGAAVDALIGNVLAHTPEGTAFRVELTGTETRAALVVEDEGPGLPAGPVDRRRGLSGTGSTGLGLDIVRRTAERSQGAMSTGRANGRGARVEVTFGRDLTPAGGPPPEQPGRPPERDPSLTT